MRSSIKCEFYVWMVPSDESVDVSVFSEEPLGPESVEESAPSEVESVPSVESPQKQKEKSIKNNDEKSN